jgi:hypothetical protein
MTAEIIRLIAATRIVGEHLRCPACNGRDAYANIGAQSFAFSRRHSMVWYVGQNYSDKWLRQTPSQWAVNKHHLDRWDAYTRNPRTAPAVVNPGMQRETHSRVCSEGTSALPRGLREHLQLTPPAPTREPPGPSGGVGARREHQQPHLCHGPPAPAGTTIRGANAALRRGGYSWAPATIQRCLPALPTSCSPMGPTSTVSSSPR